MKFRTDLVVERHLVTADRALIGRIKGNDHGPTSELAEREILIGCAARFHPAPGFATSLTPIDAAGDDYRTGPCGHLDSSQVRPTDEVVDPHALN